MARLPVQGSDDGQWGTILNDFLLQVHAPNGTIKPGSVQAAAIAGLATVATSGSYNDLTNKPVIPATAADVGAVANASGAPGRYLGYGSSLPSSGMQAGDLFLLIDNGI
ncbi:MAG TPA: hypothetical protein VD735_01485 [Candidatus Saccharimonadales bacterium]|nr:hypothetical protein [Candidatus Saccharimonadales bacterium]